MSETMVDETMNECEECGARFYYAAELHECASKGRPTPARILGESWVDECMRKQRDGIVR